MRTPLDQRIDSRTGAGERCLVEGKSKRRGLAGRFTSLLGEQSVHVSAKTEYACLAVMELAANYGSGEPVRVRMIAQLHGIPSRFLVQILLQLKGAGLVASTRGAAGGYQLVKQPSDITLADVMSVIEGTPEEVTQSASSETANSRVLLSVWNDVGRVQREMLSSITFAGLIERAESEAEYMYYI